MHLQLYHTTWVLYGHGPKRENQPRFACRISPALLHYKDKEPIPFEEVLPKDNQEYERITCWGWRFYGLSEVDSTKWRLGQTQEECLEQANKIVKNDLEHEPAQGRFFSRAMSDIREITQSMI